MCCMKICVGVNDYKKIDVPFVTLLGFTVKNKTGFKYTSPIWLLGKRYAAKEHGKKLC